MANYWRDRGSLGLHIWKNLLRVVVLCRMLFLAPLLLLLLLLPLQQQLRCRCR